MLISGTRTLAFVRKHTRAHTPPALELAIPSSHASPHSNAPPPSPPQTHTHLPRSTLSSQGLRPGSRAPRRVGGGVGWAQCQVRRVQRQVCVGGGARARCSPGPQHSPPLACCSSSQACANHHLPRASGGCTRRAGEVEWQVGASMWPMGHEPAVACTHAGKRNNSTQACWPLPTSRTSTHMSAVTHYPRHTQTYTTQSESMTQVFMCKIAVPGHRLTHPWHRG